MKKPRKSGRTMKRTITIKQRFCPLCRHWYPWGYVFQRHKCCKKHPTLVMEFGWEMVERLHGKEYVQESRRIMQQTQSRDAEKQKLIGGR